MTRICLLHFFDPRGDKLGGLETYCRDFIRFSPDYVEILVVGIDTTGHLPLGQATDIKIFNKAIKFFPVAHWPADQISVQAKSLKNSLTVHGAVGLIRFLPQLRKLLRQGGYSLDCRRIELGPICWLLGVPYAAMMHDEGNVTIRDNLINKYIKLYRCLEFFTVRSASKFFCVNAHITQSMQRRFPKFSAKFVTVFTWYDDKLIQPVAFEQDDNVFRVCFFGRLDIVKNPPLMFKALALVREKVELEFHYGGNWKPEVYPDFSAIRDCTIQHGFVTMPQIAKILEKMHCGILTSTMEGFPRSVAECLGGGRPVVAVHLPQLEELFSTGKAGKLLPRTPELAQELANALLATFEMIKNRQIKPEEVAETVAEYKAMKQLTKVYEYHSGIDRRI